MTVTRGTWLPMPSEVSQWSSGYQSKSYQAVAKGEGTLDMEATSHDDLLDAFRLSLQYWVGD